MAKKQAKTPADWSAEVESALLRRALGFVQEETYAEDIVDKKSGEVVEAVKRKTIQKTVPPDVRALLFWLKNRLPQRWRERIEFEEDAEDYQFDGDDAAL